MPENQPKRSMGKNHLQDKGQDQIHPGMAPDLSKENQHKHDNDNNNKNPTTEIKPLLFNHISVY